MINIRESLTFDDILLCPSYSDVRSRKDIDLTISLPKIGTKLLHPIIPANMKTIFGYEMAEAVLLNGGLGFIHRFMHLSDQIDIVKRLKDKYGEERTISHIGFSIGVQREDYDNMEEYLSEIAKIIVIDIAHGHSKICIDMCKHISKEYPHILLVAGNVATYQGAKDLFMNGADVCKVGIGNGATCSTRIETGNGVPQITALIDTCQARDDCKKSLNKELFIISDGGIRSAGDCVKSLCFADLVMTGLLFSGCDETPGDIINIDGKSYKMYVGSSTHKTDDVNIEGVKALVECKKSFSSILKNICGGIRSGCSYQGAHNLSELKENPEFIRISNAGLIESHPHDVLIRG
jgi:IMP dehydrogenase